MFLVLPQLSYNGMLMAILIKTLLIATLLITLNARLHYVLCTRIHKVNYKLSNLQVKKFISKVIYK